MRNYFIFYPDSGGMIDSRELSIHIEHMPPIQRAEERVERITIPGRSGILTKKQGENVYNAYTKSFEIVALDKSKIQEILRLLRGNGKIIFSNEPQYRYTISITDGLSFYRTFQQWHKAMLSMEIFPFKESTEEKVCRGIWMEEPPFGWKGYFFDLNIETDVPCPFFLEINDEDYPRNVLINLNETDLIQFIKTGKILFVDNEKAVAYDENGKNQLDMSIMRYGIFPMRFKAGKNQLSVSMKYYSNGETIVRYRGWFL